MLNFFHGFSLRKDKTLFSLEGDFKVVVLDPEFLSTSSNPGGGVILLPRVYELGEEWKKHFWNSRSFIFPLQGNPVWGKFKVIYVIRYINFYLPSFSSMSCSSDSLTKSGISSTRLVNRAPKLAFSMAWNDLCIWKLQHSTGKLFLKIENT